MLSLWKWRLIGTQASGDIDAFAPSDFSHRVEGLSSRCTIIAALSAAARIDHTQAVAGCGIVSRRTRGAGWIMPPNWVVLVGPKSVY